MSPFTRLTSLLLGLFSVFPAHAQWTFSNPGVAVSNINTVAYGNNRFVAGVNGGQRAVILSSDGTTWRLPTGTITGKGTRAIFANGVFTLMTLGGLYRSIDGDSWTTLYTGSLSDTNTRGAMAISGTAHMVAQPGASPLFSADGVNWRNTSPLPGATLNGRIVSIEALAGRFYVSYIANPTVSQAGEVASTTDGLAWTKVVLPTASFQIEILAGNGRVVANLGFTPPGQPQLASILSSGEIVVQPADPAVFSLPIPLAYTAGQFIRISTSVSPAIIQKSSDGVTYTDLATRPSGSPLGYINDVAYGAGRYLAGGLSFGTPGGAIVAQLIAETAPRIVSAPTARTSIEGALTTFAVTLENPDTATTFQWRRDGVAIPGATSATLTLARTTLADAGLYSCAITNALGTTSSDPAQLNVVPFSQGGRLFSLSVLTSLDAPDTDFTVGFALDGAGAANPKSLLVRAAGPSLAQFGISAFLPDPRLRFFANGVLAGENNDWGGTAPLTALATQTGAFGFTGATTTDAALGVANVTTTSNTVVISSATPGRGTGSVIAEIYDATPTPAITPATPRLRALSVLKPIATGTSLTAGFSINGVTSKTVLIRAVGPGLTQINVPGVLADPLLTLNRVGTPVAIATNDNWGGSATLRDSFTAAGTFGLDASSRDSALVMTLTPGAYTAVASGVANSSGNVLIEIYELP